MQDTSFLFDLNKKELQPNRYNNNKPANQTKNSVDFLIQNLAQM